MSIKYRLQEYKSVKENIQEFEDRLLEIDTTLQRITSTISADKVQTTKDPDKWTDLIAEKVKVQNKINRELQKLYKEMGFIEDVIETLPEKEKRLIRLRYINCLMWEEVCVEMGYEWRQTHYIHARILRKLDNSAYKCTKNV